MLQFVKDFHYLCHILSSRQGDADFQTEIRNVFVRTNDIA